MKKESAAFNTLTQRLSIKVPLPFSRKSPASAAANVCQFDKS